MSQDWSGSVTPSLAGYSFAPGWRGYSNIASDQPGQDYTAAAVSAAAIYFIHTDHLNTPRLIANGAGQAVWRWDNVDPFGGNVPDENPSGLGVFTCNLRLPGQYFDKETNTHYNYFRDYDPAVGRYLEADPLGLEGGDSVLYAYVFNDPLSGIDPYGLVNVNPNDPLKNSPGGLGGLTRGGACCAPIGVGNVGSRPKPINLPAASKIKIDMPHIQSGHMVGGPRAQPGSAKTLFPENMTAAQVEKAIRDAYRNCARVKTQGNNVLVRGTSRDGLQIEMWVDLETKTVLTAYPVY